MPKPRKVGRKLKLTDEVRTKLVNALKIGSYVNQAVVYAGIGVSTFYEWLQQADEDANAGKSTPFTELADAIKKAEADAEVRLLTIINQQAPNNWQAAMTVLERRHPDRWGRRDRMDVADLGKIGADAAQPFDASKLTTEELRQLYALQRKMQPSEASR